MPSTNTKETIDSGFKKSVPIEEEPSHEIYLSLFPKSQRERMSSAYSSFRFTQQQSVLSIESSCTINDPENSIIHKIPIHETVRKNDSKDDTDKNKMNNNPIIPKHIKIYQQAFASPPKLSALSLDKSNKGYQLLSNLGWKENEGGLGRNRQGSLEPIQTQYKTNKRGIGSGEKLPWKVTHQFNPSNQHQKLNNGLSQNVNHSTKQSQRDTTTQKNIQQRKKMSNSGRDSQKYKKEEMDSKRARFLINSDLPSEYEAYLFPNR